MRKIIGSQQGVAAVEFSIILPLLILITFGIIEFGVMLFNQQIITNACREGARVGVVARITRVSVNDIDQTIMDGCKYLITFGTNKDPNIDVTGYSTTAKFGDHLTVKVQYEYSFLVLSTLISPKTLTAVSEMTYE